LKTCPLQVASWNFYKSFVISTRAFWVCPFGHVFHHIRIWNKDFWRC
jgi:hypothetical protein